MKTRNRIRYRKILNYKIKFITLSSKSLLKTIQRHFNMVFILSTQHPPNNYCNWWLEPAVVVVL